MLASALRIRNDRYQGAFRPASKAYLHMVEAHQSLMELRDTHRQVFQDDNCHIVPGFCYGERFTDGELPQVAQREIGFPGGSGFLG